MVMVCLFRGIGEIIIEIVIFLSFMIKRKVMIWNIKWRSKTHFDRKAKAIKHKFIWEIVRILLKIWEIWKAKRKSCKTEGIQLRNQGKDKINFYWLISIKMIPIAISKVMELPIISISHLWKAIIILQGKKVQRKASKVNSFWLSKNHSRKLLQDYTINKEQLRKKKKAKSHISILQSYLRSGKQKVN